jgi:opacity protein-like surface antigen
MQIRLLLFVIALGVAAQAAFSRDYRMGYGLAFSANELHAAKINKGFTDISSGGHTSFFFIETPLVGNLLIQMAPGAMNFQDNESQFHVQYTVLGVNYRMGHQFFSIIGAGIGGSIATLTKGSGDYGEAQTGLFIRNTTLLWMSRIGAGYRFANNLELLLEARGMRFFDNNFSNLDSFNLGATISIKIK